MAFEEIRIAAGKTIVKAPAKIGLAKLRGAKARCRVILDEQLVQRMNWPLDGKLVVLMGRGEDAGKIRLQLNNSKGTARLDRRSIPRGEGGHYYVVALGHLDVFADESSPSQPVAYEKIDSVTLEINASCLPKPRTAVAVGPRQLSAAGSSLTGDRLLPPPQRTGASVTAGLTGDPHPSRSALAGR